MTIQNEAQLEDMIVFEYGLFAKVQVNQHSGYALLDTGATRTGVAAKAAQGLEVLRQSTMGGANSVVDTQIYAVPKLNFAGLEFQNVQADNADSRVGFPADVLLRLGTPELLSQPLVLDFKQLKVGFVQAPLSSKMLFPKADFVRSLPFLDLEFAEQKVRTLFDSGAGYSVLNTAHLEKLGINTDLVFDLPVFDANRTTVVHKIVSIGGFSCLGNHFPTSECILMDLSSIEKALDTRIDFILGANTLLRAGWIWVIDKSKNSIGFITHGLSYTE